MNFLELRKGKVRRIPFYEVRCMGLLRCASK
jgi:hypothetical protein